MSEFLRSFTSVVTRPFTGLGTLVLLYVVMAHLLYPHNDILRGNLPDPDDYMYLVQTMDWMNGQAWFDNVQHRLDPPFGTAIPFSRFVQMPLALGIFIFHKVGLPLRGAATLTALIEPLLLLGCCMAAFKKMAVFFMPRDWSGVTSYIALFSFGLLYEFTPGHVDHHGLIMLMMIGVLGCAMKMIDAPDNRHAAFACGALMAVTMMVALESLPWELLLSACLGLWSIRHGGHQARGGAIFGVALFVVSIACLMVTVPPARYFDMDVLVYSTVYVFLALAIAVPFVGVYLARQKKMLFRAGIGVGLAGVTAALFLHFFPALLGGPYGAIDPQLVKILLDDVQEARPILKTSDGMAHLINLMLMCFVSLIASVFFTMRAREAAREKWLLLLLFLASACGLTVFYQYRFLGMACALSIIPLAVLLQRGWDYCGGCLQGWKCGAARALLLIVVAPLPALIIPALVDGRSFYPSLVLFPVDPGRNACDMVALEGFLRDPHGLGAAPHRIINPMEEGPELLFRSDDEVLAAPFHMNIQGNLDAERFLSTPFAAEAEKIASRRQADIIVLCRAVPAMYLGEGEKEKSFIEALFTGTLPPWLERISSPRLSNFMVLRVRDDVLKSDAVK